MNDYDVLADILEMAELLTHQLENTLEVDTINDTTGKTETVIFKFNDEKELESIYTE